MKSPKTKTGTARRAGPSRQARYNARRRQEREVVSLTVNLCPRLKERMDASALRLGVSRRVWLEMAIAEKLALEDAKGDPKKRGITGSAGTGVAGVILGLFLGAASLAGLPHFYRPTLSVSNPPVAKSAQALSADFTTTADSDTDSCHQKIETRIFARSQGGQPQIVEQERLQGCGMPLVILWEQTSTVKGTHPAAQERAK